MTTLRDLKKKIQSSTHKDNTEATRFKGEYYLLHICQNGVPVPLFYSKDITEVDNYLDRVLEN